MKKHFYYKLIIINVISIIFGFFNLQNISNEIIFLPLSILISLEIFMILEKDIIINLSLDKKKILISIFLCTLFFIMLPITSCLNKLFLFSNIFILNYVFKIIFSLSLFFSLLLIFLLILSYEGPLETDTIKTRRIIILVISCIALLFIGSTSTGFYDYDFPGIWVRDKIGWNNWQTFGFSFLVYFCRIIFHSPYVIILLNFVLYLYFSIYALRILERQSKNKNILILYFLITLLTIVGFDQLRYLKKDTLFALGLCNLILTITDYLILNKFTKKIVINLIVFSIITVLFRHGALYLLIFIYLILIILVIIRKQYMGLLYIGIAILSFCGSYFLLNYIGFNILHSYKYPKNVMYTVPIYQVGAFAQAGYGFSESEKNYLEQYLPIDYMANNFNKYDGDALARGWRLPSHLDHSDDFNYRKLISVNFDLFIHRPIFYTKTLLDLTNILWKIEPDNYEWYIYFYKSKWSDWEMGETFKDYAFESKETPLNKIVEPIVDIGLKSFLFNFRVRGGFPLFMIILSSLVFIYKKKYKFLIPISFILFWYGCLFLSLPTGIIRYILPFINIYPFIFCLSLGTKK